MNAMNIVVAGAIAGLAVAGASGCPGDADLSGEFAQFGESAPADARGSDPLGGVAPSTCEQRQGENCYVGQGLCRRVGVLRCVGDEPFCDGTAGRPYTEVCGNGDDEDCDGVADEAPAGGCCADADCAAGERCRISADAVAAGQCMLDTLASQATADAEPEQAPAADEEPVVLPTPEPDPICGNRVLEGDEQCEVGVGGATVFTCSAACEVREVYGTCSSDEATEAVRSVECNGNDPDQVCVPLYPWICLPLRHPSQPCPDLGGRYTQEYVEKFGRGLCVVTCESEGDCPDHLPVCAPLWTDDDDALAVCLPGV